MFETLSTKTLFSYKRLDLIIKFLYAQDLLNDYHNEEVKNLYIRHILMRTGGIEPQDFLKNKSNKTSINDYLDNFKELLFSIKNNGFDSKYPIPITYNNMILNGAHRVACSMALNQEVYVQRYDNASGCWAFEWFDINGFSNEDKMRILKGFIDINKENSAIMIIWKPIYEYIDHIKNIINKDLDIVGEIELNFENNFIAFNNAILDIYNTNSLNKNQYENIISKAELLQTCELSFKVIVLTNQEKNNDKNIYDIVKNVKKKIREYFDFYVSKDVFITVHASDSIEELTCLSNVVLSVNSIRELKKRLNYIYDENFLKFCEECKEQCKNNNIDINDICIIGSAPMAVYGIKMVSDIDFVTKYKYREKFGDAPVHLSNNIDIASRTYHRNGTNNFINDDLLIDNDNYHFTFNDLKFANLWIIKERKQFSAREKDLRHVRKIELFENLIENVDQRQILKSRILEEQNRRNGIKNNYEEINKNIKDLYEKINLIQEFNKHSCKKYSKWLINLCACFIVKRKNRHHFRKKYSK